MKRAILLIMLLFPILTMGGCSLLIEMLYITDYEPSHNEKLWKHRDTKEPASFNSYTSCFYKSVNDDFMKKNLPLGYMIEDWDKATLEQGKCLYSQGYIFTGNIFDKFCHHPDTANECKIFKRFKR